MRAGVGDVLHRLIETAGAEFWTGRQIHVSLYASQLHSRKAILLGEIKPLVPVPGWTAKRLKSNWKTLSSTSWGIQRSSKQMRCNSRYTRCCTHTSKKSS